MLGAIIPIAAMLYFSRVLAIENEHQQLALIAQRIISRADISFADATLALRQINAFTEIPCSPAHIARMREITASTRAVEEIGYFENGLMKCTSWGVTEGEVREEAPNFTIADGIGVTVDVHPLVAERTPMMALHLGAYNVLIDPVRFVDVIVDPDIKLAIATDKGMLLARLNNPDPTLITRIIAGHRTKGIEDGYLFAVSRARNWAAVAVEDQRQALDGLRQQQALLVPFGICMALLNIGGIVWFSRRRLSPLGELQIAVRRREFIVHYQPIVEIRTGRCVGAEALVRWRPPDGSLLSPDLFIPLAESSGLIKPITDQVITLVVADLGQLLATDRSMHIAINLCAEDVATGRVLPVIEKALRNTGIQPDQIWLEMTERGFIDIDAACTTLTRARELGYSAAIDDFGTGYSRLSYLESLPLDALKIDKSFIDTIDTDSATSSVTSHIIDMAKTLKLVIVAEGIESQYQADYLTKRGVEYGQGWLFARPIPAEEFVDYYQKTKTAA
ncbi:EAL domain-containing protein [Pseudorhodoplanes sinuspersici]|uniref:EAL domain-containing protein n=1 Tax=Pseudorhodoplanes sinuspersici TaxID=1235591 RepID=UPI00315A9FD9